MSDPTATAPDPNAAQPTPAAAAAPAQPPAQSGQPTRPYITSDDEATQLAQGLASGKIPQGPSYDAAEAALHDWDSMRNGRGLSEQQASHVAFRNAGGADQTSSPEPTARDLVGGAARGANRGAAYVLGFPVDMLSSVDRLLGGNPGVAPVGGHQSIEDLGNRVLPGSFSTPNENPSARTLGDVMSFVGPGDLARLGTGALERLGAEGTAEAASGATRPAAGDALGTVRAAGYKLRPSDVAAAGGNPGKLGPVLERFGGPTPLAQDFTAHNQGVTNRLGESLTGAPVTPESVAVAKTQPGQVYSAVGEGMGEWKPSDELKSALETDLAPNQNTGLPQYKPAVTKILQGVHDSDNLDGPGFMRTIQQLRDAGAYGPARDLEDEVARQLGANGSDQDLAAFQGARRQFAQLYDLQRTANPATGAVNAARAAQLPAVKSGQATGPLATAATARQYAPAVTGTPKGAAGPGADLSWHSAVPIAALAGLGTAHALHYGGLPIDAAGGILASLPALRAAARAYIAGPYQRFLGPEASPAALSYLSQTAPAARAAQAGREAQAAAAPLERRPIALTPPSGEVGPPMQRTLGALPQGSGAGTAPLTTRTQYPSAPEAQALDAAGRARLAAALRLLNGGQ